MNTNKGKLIIVSTPIANPEDISLRAIRVMKEADFIIGEEQKRLRQLLKQLEIVKDHDLLNEHSKEDDVELYLNMLLAGKTIALVCDAGTPLLADPGFDLVEIARASGISIDAVPGASALLTALVLSGFSMKSFYFRGFLNRDKNIRLEELKEMKYFKDTQILYETPYRYKRVLEDMKKVMGNNRIVFLGLKLTSSEQKIYRLPLAELCQKLDSLPKAEPVIIF